ncbi:MAG: hypothetical protein L0312_34090, partial [Acidobacteria bacterium]|nr:hypothetical protein [Acidobacteriota bacterium]
MNDTITKEELDWFEAELRNGGAINAADGGLELIAAARRGLTSSPSLPDYVAGLVELCQNYGHPITGKAAAALLDMQGELEKEREARRLWENSARYTGKQIARVEEINAALQARYEELEGEHEAALAAIKHGVAQAKEAQAEIEQLEA